MIRTWTSWMEKAINSRDFFIGLYEKYYGKIVSREADLADIKNRDRVLCIGGGAIPCTAMALAQYSNRIDVLDQDQAALEKAQKLVRRKGLAEKLSLIEGNGKTIDPFKYDVIHIALQVDPKDQVLDNIIARARKGTRILVRQPKSYLRPFYSDLSWQKLGDYNCQIERRSLAGSRSTMEDVLLLVKE